MTEEQARALVEILRAVRSYWVTPTDHEREAIVKAILACDKLQDAK